VANAFTNGAPFEVVVEGRDQESEVYGDPRDRVRGDDANWWLKGRQTTSVADALG